MPQLRPPDENTNWTIRALVLLMVWMTVSNTLFQWFGKPYQESWWLTSMISAALLAVVYTSYEGRKRKLERRVEARSLQRKQRILLIEDSPFAQSLIRKLLHQQDTEYDLDIAPSAEQALKMLRRERPYQMYEPPDQIVLDLALPDMSGSELLEIIKLDPRLSWIPVVIWTGTKEPDDGDLALANAKAWATVWVEKGPASPDVVMDAIKEAADISAVSKPRWLQLRSSSSGQYPAIRGDDDDSYDVNFTPGEEDDDST